MDVKEQYQRLSDQFILLRARERKLFVGAILFVILYGGFLAFLEPLMNDAQQKEQRYDQLVNEKRSLEQQLAIMGSGIENPDEPLLVRKQKLEVEYQRLKEQLELKTKQLIPPSAMRPILVKLLNKYPGVKLQKLASMEPVALDLNQASEAGNHLFQRGVELTITGDYFSIQQYVAAVQAIESQLFWDQFKYQVAEYPEGKLTIQLYTLTINPSFLEV